MNGADDRAELPLSCHLPCSFLFLFRFGWLLEDNAMPGCKQARLLVNQIGETDNGIRYAR